jgi:hypothetical protein
MMTVFATVTAASMEDAYRQLTLDQYVDRIWEYRRAEIRRRNAWALIRWNHRRLNPHRPPTTKRSILDDIKAALAHAFGALAVILLIALVLSW